MFLCVLESCQYRKLKAGKIGASSRKFERFEKFRSASIHPQLDSRLLESELGSVDLFQDKRNNAFSSGPDDSGNFFFDGDIPLTPCLQTPSVSQPGNIIKCYHKGRSAVLQPTEFDI